MLLDIIGLLVLVCQPVCASATPPHRGSSLFSGDGLDQATLSRRLATAALHALATAEGEPTDAVAHAIDVEMRGMRCSMVARTGEEAAMDRTRLQHHAVAVPPVSFQAQPMDRRVILADGVEKHCTTTSSCPVGEFCAKTMRNSSQVHYECFNCSVLDLRECGDKRQSRRDCCSAAFLTQCPSNPYGCCKVDADCRVGEECMSGYCVNPEDQAHDKAALLAGIKRSELPTAAVAWNALPGWNASSDPCDRPRCGPYLDGINAPIYCAWEGVGCLAGRVTWLEFSGLPQLAFEVSTELGDLPELSVLNLPGLPLMTGTLPSSLDKLSNLWMLGIHNTQISGTLPRLGCRSLQMLRIFQNQRLSGTLPSEISQMPMVYELDVHGNTMLSGSLPDLRAAIGLRNLDAGGCSFSRLPPALPSSITHLYLNDNPLNSSTSELGELLGTLSATALRVLNVGFSSAHIVLECRHGSFCTKNEQNPDRGGFGTRVYNPRQCHIGDALCAFVLEMMDSDDKPVRVGGMINNLTLTFYSQRPDRYYKTMMKDNRNGTFTAAIPPAWVNQTGEYLFHFQHNGVEFFPRVTNQYFAAQGPDCPTVDDSYICSGLRTIEFLKKQCPDGSHTVADDMTGATCICEEGFVNDITTNASCVRNCGSGEAVSSDGSCACTGRAYDTTLNGIIICSVGEWEPPENDRNYREAQSVR